MSRLTRGSKSQAEACGSSDRSRADVLFDYISSEHPTGVSLAALKLCHIPYPMTSYPRYKLTKTLLLCFVEIVYLLIDVLC